MEHPVFVSVVEVGENGEGVDVRLIASVVWLQLRDFIAECLGDPWEFGSGLREPGLGLADDGELQFDVGGWRTQTGLSDGSGVDEVVEGASVIVDTVTNIETENGRRLLPDAEAEIVLGAITVALDDQLERRSFDPSAGRLGERLEMVIALSDLGHRPRQVDAHTYPWRTKEPQETHDTPEGLTVPMPDRKDIEDSLAKSPPRRIPYRGGVRVTLVEAGRTARSSSRSNIGPSWFRWFYRQAYSFRHPCRELVGTPSGASPGCPSSPVTRTPRRCSSRNRVVPINACHALIIKEGCDSEGIVKG